MYLWYLGITRLWMRVWYYYGNSIIEVIKVCSVSERALITKTLDYA